MNAIVKQQPLTNVFVYGTLKRFQPNHSLLKEAKYLGTATCSGILLDLGMFPALLECADGGQNVEGELFEVKDQAMWDSLDRLEGHPNHYKRLPIQTSNGWAYTYIYQRYDQNNHGKYHMVNYGNWHKNAATTPFLGFRKSLEGMPRIVGLVHLADDPSGFAGLISLSSGAALTTNGKQMVRPHYVYDYTNERWTLAKDRHGVVVDSVIIPPARSVVPEINASRLPVVINTKPKEEPKKYVDDTDPGEEDIGAVVNA